MLLLTGTSDIVRVVTDASGDIRVHASFAENDAGAITPLRTNTASIGSATTTTVVASPASSKQRNVRYLSLRNVHASQAVVVTVQHYDGTNSETLMKVTLLAGESLILDDKGCWTHFGVNGDDYPKTYPLASRANMEAATDLEVGVTPGRQHYHPGHPKCALKCGVAGDIKGAPYNISSVTDTGAGLVQPIINVDFSSVDWCCLAATERTTTTLTVTNLKNLAIRAATQAAGGVTLESYDQVASTHVQEDPTSWHLIGLGTLV